MLRAHQCRRHVTIDDVRTAIKDAAYLTGGEPGPQTQALVARLERATGISIAELAKAVEKWPEV